MAGAHGSRVLRTGTMRDEKFFKELLFELDGTLACLLSSVVLTRHFAFAKWDAERRVWNGACHHTSLPAPRGFSWVWSLRYDRPDACDHCRSETGLFGWQFLGVPASHFFKVPACHRSRTCSTLSACATNTDSSSQSEAVDTTLADKLWRMALLCSVSLG